MLFYIRCLILCSVSVLVTLVLVTEVRTATIVNLRQEQGQGQNQVFEFTGKNENEVELTNQVIKEDSRKKRAVSGRNMEDEDDDDGPATTPNPNKKKGKREIPAFNAHLAEFQSGPTIEELDEVFKSVQSIKKRAVSGRNMEDDDDDDGAATTASPNKKKGKREISAPIQSSPTIEELDNIFKPVQRRKKRAFAGRNMEDDDDDDAEPAKDAPKKKGRGIAGIGSAPNPNQAAPGADSGATTEAPKKKAGRGIQGRNIEDDDDDDTEPAKEAPKKKGRGIAGIGSSPNPDQAAPGADSGATTEAPKKKGGRSIQGRGIEDDDDDDAEPAKEAAPKKKKGGRTIGLGSSPTRRPDQMEPTDPPPTTTTPGPANTGDKSTRDAAMDSEPTSEKRELTSREKAAYLSLKNIIEHGENAKPLDAPDSGPRDLSPKEKMAFMSLKHIIENEITDNDEDEKHGRSVTKKKALGERERTDFEALKKHQAQEIQGHLTVLKGYEPTRDMTPREEAAYTSLLKAVANIERFSRPGVNVTSGVEMLQRVQSKNKLASQGKHDPMLAEIMEMSMRTFTLMEKKIESLSRSFGSAFTALNGRFRAEEKFLKTIKEQIDDLETQTRKKNLILSGYQDQEKFKEDDLISDLKALFTKRMNFTPDLDRAWRQGDYNATAKEPRKIKLVMVKDLDRIKIMKQRKAVEEDKLKLTYDFTPMQILNMQTIRAVDKYLKASGIEHTVKGLIVTVGRHTYTSLDGKVIETTPPKLKKELMEEELSEKDEKDITEIAGV